VVFILILPRVSSKIVGRKIIFVTRFQRMKKNLDVPSSGSVQKWNLIAEW
jgi:hypothetical protein